MRTDKRTAHQQRRGRSHWRNPGAQPSEPHVVALRLLVAECEAALAALGEKPESGAARAFWCDWDAQHGVRADFVLWRRLRGLALFRGRLTEVVEPALRALRSVEAEVRWGALSLLPAIPFGARAGELAEGVRAALRSEPPAKAPQSVAWVRWLAGAWLGHDAAAVLEEGRVLFERLSPGWKPGRPLDLPVLRSENWLPVAPSLARRWAASALSRLVREGRVEKAGAWTLTAWQLLRDARPADAGAGVAEVEMLLNAAGWARAEGRPMESARLAVLALHLAPERGSDRLWRRCRVAAWAVAEAGLKVPERWGARLDAMPFPGDPPQSERGREAAAWFDDLDDPACESLRRQVEAEPDWQVLRDAGMATHHPLPMLAWVARKAQAHAVKKQHDLLAAAARLALRHHCLVSAAKLLAVRPGEAAVVVELARQWRAGWRQMPVLRDEATWREAAEWLRAAWGRLETQAIADEETLFFLHETFCDRALTTRLRLPEALKTEDEAEMAHCLRAEPRLLASLEHQRAVELWEVRELTRREDMAGVVWVSVAGMGEAASGRFSVLLLKGGDVRTLHLRLERGGAEAWLGSLRGAVEEAVREAAGEGGVQAGVLSLDTFLPATGWNGLWVVPSWESVFRLLRERSLPEVLSAPPCWMKRAN